MAVPAWIRTTARLVVAVVLGVMLAATAVVIAGSATNRFRVVPVLTGSMTPVAPKGAIVVVAPVATRDVRVGDIILFHAPIPDRPLVVHRVIHVDGPADARRFQTKGDANPAPDPWTAEVRGGSMWRVRAAVPKVGKLLAWSRDPVLYITALVGGVAIAASIALRGIWLPDPANPRAPTRRERRRRRRWDRGVAIVRTALISVMIIALGVEVASAVWVASAPPIGAAYTSGTLGDPSPLDCSWTGANAIGLTWQSTSPTVTAGYDWLRSNTSGSGYTVGGSVTGATTVTATDANPAPPAKRYYVVRAKKGSWTGPSTNEKASVDCRYTIRLSAGTGTAGFAGDGAAATSAQLSAPDDVAVDASGNVYVADAANNRIRRISATTGVISTFAGGGATTACSYSGAATGVSLSAPGGVAVDSSGDVYVADTGNGCIRRITAAGVVSFVAGGGATAACTYTGAATGVTLSNPDGVAVDAAGAVYIADTGRNCIRKVSAGTVSQFAGGGTTTQCSFAGAATAASLNAPRDVAVDAAGAVYIADTARGCIRKVVGGAVSLFAGGGTTNACTYTGAATAVNLSSPRGLTVAASGTVYIADTNRSCIRSVVGGTVAQVAGTGTASSTGDDGAAFAATLNKPAGVAMNPSGGLVIADTNGNRVRRIDRP